MIHEEICTYEVCKLAKEKGFPQDVFGTCEMKSSCYLEDGRYYKDGCIYPIENAYTAPTQSLLQRWLREEANLHTDVGVWEDYDEDADGLRCGTYSYWSFNIQSCLTGDLIYEEFEHRYDTYELALEDALKYVLENLV